MNDDNACSYFLGRRYLWRWFCRGFHADRLARRGRSAINELPSRAFRVGLRGPFLLVDFLRNNRVPADRYGSDGRLADLDVIVSLSTEPLGHGNPKQTTKAPKRLWNLWSRRTLTRPTSFSILYHSLSRTNVYEITINRIGTHASYGYRNLSVPKGCPCVLDSSGS